MGLLPEGEVLRTSRRYSLILITIGALFLVIGLWATGIMRSRGDAGMFLYIWGAFWFLGTGAALFAGLSGFIKPPLYALLSEHGIAFPSLRVTHIPWSHILGVRLGPKTTTDSKGTSHVFTSPLILHLRDLAPLQSGQAARWTQGQTALLPDGTAEWMMQTHNCPLPATELLSRIQARVDPSRLPDTQPATTFGGVPLNPPRAPKSFFGKIGFGGIISVVVGVLILVGAFGSWSKAQDGKTWIKNAATIEYASVVRHTAKRHRTVSWRIQLDYRFTHSGVVFHGRDLHYRYNDGVRSFVEGRLRDFPPGDPVSIYYNPRDPSQSAFFPPTANDAKVFFFLGGFFLLFGVIIFLTHRLRS